MRDPLSWGILGPGAIAHKFAAALKETKSGKVMAVASRKLERAKAFASTYAIPTAYGSYRALLEDPHITAVYIATPHPMHKEWTLEAATYGKAVLCEKPAAMNAVDAVEMISACRKAGVFFMEAFMYRCHPQIQKALDLLNDGAIGELLRIDTSFGFKAKQDPTSRLFSPALGGGAILDIGCYPVSLARLVAGHKQHRSLNPTRLEAQGTLNSCDVDEHSQAILEFDNGLRATLTASLISDISNKAVITGTDGSLVIDEPWQPDKKLSAIHVRPTRGRSHTHTFSTKSSHYAMQADLVAKHHTEIEAPYPAMTHSDTIGNMETLDRWCVALDSKR